MHVWHFESHRLVVSRYKERGNVPTTAGRDGGVAVKAPTPRSCKRCPLWEDPAARRAPSRARAVRRVNVPGQRAPTGTAAAARTAHTGGGFASGRGEFLRLDDFHADSLEIRDREAAARPVGAGQNSTVGRYTDSRAPAARA